MGLGAWIAWRSRRWLWGVDDGRDRPRVLAVDVRFMIPSYRGEPYPHLGRYAHLGASLGEIVADSLLHPLGTLGSSLSAGPRRVPGRAAGAARLPAAARRRDLIGGLPALAQNLLASDPILYEYRTQYQSFVLPFLILAAIGGYARLARRHAGPMAGGGAGRGEVASLALASRTVNNLAFARWWPGPEQRAAYRGAGPGPAGRRCLRAGPVRAPPEPARRASSSSPSEIDSATTCSSTRQLPVAKPAGGHHGARDGAVTIVTPDGVERRYAVAAEGGPHVLLRPVLGGSVRTSTAPAPADAPGGAPGGGPVAEERGDQGKAQPQ